MEVRKLEINKGVLQKSLRVLCDNLRPQNILLTLEAKGALTHNDVTRISAEVTNSDKVYKLIGILQTSPASAYDAFMDALRVERPDLHGSVVQIYEEQIMSNPDAAAADQVTQRQVIPSTSVTATSQAARQRQIISSTWEMMREFGQHGGPTKLVFAIAMKFSPDGDVVVADNRTKQIKIYNITGECKSSIGTNSKPQQIVVSTDNFCFMTDGTPRVTVCGLDGKYKGSFESSSPQACSHAPKLYGLAINKEGILLLGDTINKHIYKYRQNGTNLGGFKVGIAPMYIALTSKGTIVIACASPGPSTPPQVINSTGQPLYTLPHSEGLYPLNLYCRDGIIFVASSMPRGILCYSETGEYLTTLPFPIIPHGGLTMSSDGKSLLVCGSQSVQVYTPKQM